MPPTLDRATLTKWIGRKQSHKDTIRLAPAHLMEMTLDRDPRLSLGSALPPLWHWLYFLHSTRIRDLGRDGHPARGGFLPPVALPRRMWAGGRFGFARELIIGVDAEKTSAIANIVVKDGRTGPLCFVTVRHEVSAMGALLFWEEHDIVYRSDPVPGAPKPLPPMAPTDWTATETVTPSEVMLFRYSALTFNGHRIHYDRDYARDVEGHDGLVVHGPLIATLLADLAHRQNPVRKMTGFEFRAISPLYDTHPFSIAAHNDGTATILAAINAEGRLAMQAKAEFNPR
ncbi:MAG: acyl-CoA dehydrogenase [Paracoccaceae bacterium]|nr:acyl-CoA dehydrogenase [Paracoccaceae bacterium]